MRKTRRQWVNVLLFVLLVTCLTVILYTGWINENPTSWDTESEGYVIGRMYQVQHSQTENNRAGFMGIYRDTVNQYTTAELFLKDEPVSPDMFWAYTHQCGLQSNVASAINLGLCLFGFAPQSRLTILAFLNTWLFCLIFAAFCVWVYRELGAIAALLCCAGTMFSPWTLRSMGNLYWVMWAYLLPFVLCTWLCRRYEAADGLPKRAYALIVGTVLLRLLCCFEFSSSLLVAMELPVVYYFIKHFRGEKAQEQRKKWLRIALILGGLGLAAFAAAILVWLVQLTLHYGGFTAALDEILHTISLRTGAFGNVYEAAGDFKESLDVPVLQVVATYFTQGTLTGGLTMGGLLLVESGFTILTSILFACKREIQLLRRNLQLFFVVLFSTLAPLSWFVLAHGHSVVAIEISYVLFLVPTLPLLLAHCGWGAQTAHRLLLQSAASADKGETAV